MALLHTSSTKGFSVIEVLLAAGIFVIFATASAGIIIQTSQLSRSGDEYSVALSYAKEGLEAVRSIRNQSFFLLQNSNSVGLAKNASNVWEFSGTSNSFDKYTRVIKIESVYRDGSGNIVLIPGTLDSDVKRAESTVTWSLGAGRNGSLNVNEYLTYFRKPISVDGGILVYNDGAVTSKYRTYSSTDNSFSAELNLPSGDIGRSFMIRASSISNQAIAGYTTLAGTLRILCYDGSSWSEDWSDSVGGTSTTRRFDIAYERNSGDVIVLYGTNISGTNELAYRTKSGSSGCGSANWSVKNDLDSQRISGTIQWVKTAWDRRAGSNIIGAIWADSNRDLSGMLWDGNSWVNEPSSALETNLEVVSTGQDIDDFDIEFESSSGDLMVLWANASGASGVNGVRYAVCAGGTASCSWSSVQTPAGFADDATHLDISAHPDTDAIVFASIGNAANDLQIGYWNGSSWNATPNVDTSCQPPIGNNKFVSTGWVVDGANSRSVIVYDDQGQANVGWYSGNGSVFTKETDFVPTTTFNVNQRWYDVQMNPRSKNQLMFVLSDNASDLFAKSLVLTGTAFTWSNSDGGPALELNLSQSIASPFGFAYWRQ